MPTISIITPAYNCEKYLEEAVDSVLAQTLQDWEMLIIDDCSSDNTYRCMQKLAQKDNRIRIFRNKHNVGAAATRNYGIQEAQSQWIAFLDSDDLWRKEKLEKQRVFFQLGVDSNVFMKMRVVEMILKLILIFVSALMLFGLIQYIGYLQDANPMLTYASRFSKQQWSWMEYGLINLVFAFLFLINNLFCKNID